MPVLSWVKGAALAAVAICALNIAPAAAAPVLGGASYSNIYVFGDSLTEAGNVRAPASLGYYDGRFSNGPTWVDLLSRSLYGADTTKSSAGGNNFSIALARAQGNLLPIGMKNQVDAYAARPGNADPNALYILNFGANDLVAYTSGGFLLDWNGKKLPDIAAAIATQVDRLRDMGAQHILVTSGFDVGMVPLMNGSLAEAGLGRSAALRFNAALASALDGLMIEGLEMFDMLGFFDTLLASGQPIITETSCLQAGGPAATNNCAGYAFYDPTHPTALIHQLIAQGVANQLGILPRTLVAQAAAVPEPAAFGLLGLGLLAVAGLRRRSA